MRRVADGFGFARDDRVALHRGGYVWAVELGRWDDTDLAALEARFLALRDGIVALLQSPCDPRSEERWRLLDRDAAAPARGLDDARRTIDRHANRLGIFAEAEAILHYFLFRLDDDRGHS
jgi:hypothetical protein